MWEDGQKFIDEQWGEAIEGKAAAALAEGESRLDQLVEKNTRRSWQYEGTVDKARRIFAEQVRPRFKHWQPQRRNERNEMIAAIKRISDADLAHLDGAYQYPEPSRVAVWKFVKLQLMSKEQAKVCSATVYDAGECDKDIVWDVIQKSTTRSVIDVDPDLVDSIPENDHLLYLSTDGEHWQEPPFIQRNRERWWDQQTGNSSTFYFSPQRSLDSYVISWSQTIAHIFIFLQTRTSLRLRLLHRGNRQASVSIQEKSKELLFISNNEIPGQLQMQDFELDHCLEPGRHELELVVMEGLYLLRDIVIEFFDS